MNQESMKENENNNSFEKEINSYENQRGRDINVNISNENDQMAFDKDLEENKSSNLPKLLRPRSKIYNISLALLLGSGGLFFGMQMSIFNPLEGPLLKNIYNLEKEARITASGSINLYFSLGAMMIMLLCPHLSKKLGRVKTLVLAESIAVLTMVLYNIIDLRVLYLARFLAGAVAGINTAIGQLTIKELLPKSFRGLGGMIIYISVGLGVTSCFSLRVFLTQSYIIQTWRWIISSYIPVSIIRLTFFTLLLKYDTPMFYIQKKQLTKDPIYDLRAKSALRKIYKREDTDRAFEEQMDNYNALEKEDKGLLSIILADEYKERLRAALLVAMGQQLTGINFLIFFSESIFDEISGNGALQTFRIGICKFFVGIIGLYVIKRYGNKTLLIIPVLLQSFCFLLIYLFVKFNIVTGMVFATLGYICSFAIGMGPVALIYIADVLPANGIGIALAVQWFFTGVVGKLVPYLDEKLGAKFLFLLFSILCLFVALANTYFLIETKNLTDFEIKANFYKKFRGVLLENLHGVEIENNCEVEDKDVKFEQGDVKIGDEDAYFDNNKSKLLK